MMNLVHSLTEMKKEARLLRRSLRKNGHRNRIVRRSHPQITIPDWITPDRRHCGPLRDMPPEGAREIQEIQEL